MSPETGEVRQFATDQDVPDGWVNVTPGQFIEGTFAEGKKVVLFIQEANHTEHTLKVRVADKAETARFNVNRKVVEMFKP